MATNPDKRRCAAKRTNGEPCNNWAMKGMKVCRNHGGSSPQAKRAAAKRLELERAQREAERAVKTLGLARDTTPTEALLDEVKWTAGHVEWLRQKVQELEPMVLSTTIDEDGAHDVMSPHPLVHGVTRVEREKGFIRAEDESGEIRVVQAGDLVETKRVETAGPSVWYQLYMMERQQLVRVCEAALRAGVEERRVALAERQGLAVAGMLRTVLEAVWAQVVSELVARGEVAAARALFDAVVARVVPAALRSLAE